MTNHAAGVILRAPNGRMLFLQRSAAAGDYPGHWCWPGGGIEPGETAEDAARRECWEETGFRPDGPLRLIDERDGFATFLGDVPDEFEPHLNEEHDAALWHEPNGPAPAGSSLHPGAAATLHEKWDDLMPAARTAADAALAFDRASIRAYDADGRLHVEVTPISKANVCPYYGKEIPDFQSLGLDPDKLYRLYRDPDELAKAAPTFNNLPLLSRHVPVTADSHQPDLVVGSTGTDAVFEAPYLKNSLVIWARDAIGGVESNAQKELSSAYRYRADMTPGETDGEPYDGVMRDIVGNHVALVVEGRAGPDVVVGDSMENVKMAKTMLSRKAVLVQGAAMACLAPKLAADAKIDLTPAFAGVTAKNYREKKSAILAEITKRVTGKLAADANIEDLPGVLDGLDDMNPEEEAPLLIDPAKDADPADPLADIKAQIAALTEAVAKMQKAEQTEAEVTLGGDEDPEDEEEKVDKPAMDAAIAAAVKAERANAQAIRDAEKAIRPYVGELAVAQDSADGVYKAALEMLGVDVTGVHPSAYPVILKHQPVPGAAPRKPAVAQDAAAAKGFADRYPNLAPVRII